MRFIYLSVFLIGCSLEGDVSQLPSGSLIGSKGDFVSGNSNQSFTAVFKANNTDQFGVYDENTTSAVVGGKCTAGSLIQIEHTFVSQKSTFCNSDGMWSLAVVEGVWMGGILTGAGSNGLKGGSADGILVMEVGAASSSTHVQMMYSPTQFPSDNFALVDLAGEFITVRPGGNWTGSLTGYVRNIGLTVKKQYQYRFEIIRSGAVIATMGSFNSGLLQNLSVPSGYTWQNGDIVRITPYDGAGDGPIKEIPLEQEVGVSA